jgi:hypothetical protein
MSATPKNKKWFSMFGSGRRDSATSLKQAIQDDDQIQYGAVSDQANISNIEMHEKFEENEHDHKHEYRIVRAHRLINGLISELLDPNLFYSRLSFLESTKDALDIKG